MAVSAMAALRRVVFWIHLLAGVTAGSVVLVMSATGVLLTYERQMLAWADARSAPVAPHFHDAPRVPVESLLAGARAAAPRGAPSAVTVRAAADAPATVSFGRDATVLVDPYTGVALGTGSEGMRRFFRVVTDWHRWLGRSGDGRAAGRAITGACNFAFLVLVLTGAWLWLPRRWSWRQVRQVAWFRRGLAGKARDFNWHNTIGVWSVLPLVVVVASGVVMSYPWANALVYRVAGDRVPARSAPNGVGPGESRGAPATSAGVDAALLQASRQVPGWRSLQVTLPAADARRITVAIDAGTGGQPQRRGTLTVDRATGAVVRWEPFAGQSPGRRLRSLLRFAHTGEVAGLTGQTIAGLASLGAVVLVWTGIALAWRRFRAWLARRRAVDASEGVRAAA